MRLYSLLELKDFQPEQRRFSGVASTPSTDRVGDIVEPGGAVFAKEIPLLWQHEHDKPVGWAALSPQETDIAFQAQIPTITEPGLFKDITDAAWQAVKERLVRGVSIGFRPMQTKPLKQGVRFTEYEIYELSLVTIPANIDASITSIKNFAGPTGYTIPLIQPERKCAGVIHLLL